MLTFVTKDIRKLCWKLPFHTGNVRVADTRGMNLHEGLCRPQGVQRDGVKFGVRPERVDDQCFGGMCHDQRISEEALSE